MQVFELICELTNFDPYCEIMLKDKSGDLVNFKKSNLQWNGPEYKDEEGNLNIKKSKYKSSELYITLDKEIEN